jgi:hypothetical protein
MVGKKKKTHAVTVVVLKERIMSIKLKEIKLFLMF